MKIFVLISILLLGGSTLIAQSFGGEVRVNNSGPGTLQAAPQIQYGPDGRLHVVWVDFRTGRSEIAMATSTDGGVTFSAARSLFPGRTAMALMQRGVQFVIDRLGGFHMVWQEKSDLSPSSAMYARSTDGGATFSQPMFAGADSGVYAQDFPSIAVDSNETVSIAWIDDRDMVKGTTTHTYLYVTRSSDRGATFDTPKRAGEMPGGAGGSCECCNTAIAASRTGDVFIAFRGNIANNRDVHVARSTDAGATFTVLKAASSSWNINACPMTGSSIAVDRNGRAHVVWRDSRQAAAGKALVYYASLGRDATACTMDLVISDSPKAANYPTIAITSNGAIMVTWQDNRADGMDLRYVRSLDGGNTFSPSAKLTNETLTTRQELASVTVGADGTRYVAYQDTQRDDGDIIVTRDASPTITIAPDKISMFRPADGAVVSASTVLSWSTPDNLGSALQVVYDVSIIDPAGEPIRFDGVSVRSIPFSTVPGTYRWRITARTLTGESQTDEMTFTASSSTHVDDPSSIDARASISPLPAMSGSGATLHLSIPRSMRVSVTIVDNAGRIVERQLDKTLDARQHVVTIGKGLAAGFYRCIITSGASRSTLPLIVN